nr:hypothetical protein [Tanacetum cinerariifolium]
MILKSVENGPLLWPKIEENGVTKSKKYSESRCCTIREIVEETATLREIVENERLLNPLNTSLDYA